MGSPLSKTKTAGKKKATPRVSPPRKRKSLTAADWVNAALEILTTRSVEQVRVEPLARKLGTTKGSFYWHFKDRAALLSAVIEEWKRRSTVDAINWTKAGNATARQQLRRLLDFRTVHKTKWADLQIAMWAWSRRYRPVRLAAVEGDQKRLAHLCELMKDLGFPEDDVLARALIFYGTTQAVGRQTEIQPLDAKVLDKILAMVLDEHSPR
jgi:AcrR family transcriptional regulator